MIKVGVLDFGEIYKKEPDQNILADLFEIVPKVEELGFSRYWLAEHYEASVAWRTPEILLALLAGTTENIRLGVAGVLLNFHSPIRVAFTYKMLEGIFSNRIDLGLARGIPADQNLIKALLDESEPKYDHAFYKRKVDELVSFFRNSFDESHPYQGILIPPIFSAPPPIWILGAGVSSYPLAIEHGLNYCHSLFHIKIPGDHIDAFLDFKKRFEDTHQRKAQGLICVAGTCAESTAEAQKAIQGNYIAKLYAHQVFGSPSECEEQILELQQKYQVDEIIFLDISNGYENKLKSYQLLSEVLSLKENTAIS